MTPFEGSSQRCPLHRSQLSPVYVSDFASFNACLPPQPRRRQIFPRFRSIDDHSISLQRRRRVLCVRSKSGRPTPSVGHDHARTFSENDTASFLTCSARYGRRGSHVAVSMPLSTSGTQPQETFDADARRERGMSVRGSAPSLPRKTEKDRGSDIHGRVIRRHRLLPKSETFSCLSDLLKTEELSEQDGIIHSGRQSEIIGCFSPGANAREDKMAHASCMLPQKEPLISIWPNADNQLDEFWGHYKDISSCEKSNEHLFHKQAARKKYLTLDAIMEEK